MTAELPRLQTLYVEASALHTRLWLRYDEAWRKDAPDLPRLERIATRADQRWRRRLQALKRAAGQRERVPCDG